MDAIPGTYRAFLSCLDPRSSVPDAHVCVVRVNARALMYRPSPNLISCFASSVFALAFAPVLSFPLFADFSVFVFSLFISLFLPPRPSVHFGRTVYTGQHHSLAVISIQV